MASSERGRSVFDLPQDFFNGCRVVFHPILHRPSISTASPPPSDHASFDELQSKDSKVSAAAAVVARLTCNTCRAEFESLQDQRAHFKSDLHRLNVKLTVAGKHTLKEEEVDELDSDSLLKDFDLSSISGSEDEFDKSSNPNTELSGKALEESKQKVHLHLQTGEMISLWKCLLMSDSEDLALGNNCANNELNAGSVSRVNEGDLLARLRYLLHEPRDTTKLRTILLLSGGHFAGCVFDGNSIVTHKTYHRYVVRAKSGKKQSSKDATGRAAHSAGSSLRRHNEAALKKDIHELLVSWKQYFNSSSSVYVYAPSKNQNIIFDGEKLGWTIPRHVVRHIPFTVHRPTLKEAKRIYNQLTCMVYEKIENTSKGEEPHSHIPEAEFKSLDLGDRLLIDKLKETKASAADEQSTSQVKDITSLQDIGNPSGDSSSQNIWTPLHEAASSGNAQLTLELLELGMDPCTKDERGRTPYTLAKDKEVRNTFRRFMALNLDKWDWHAANVPSPLTRDMEESQAAKLAEKNAKRNAKVKELKRLRKAKEKTQAEARETENASVNVQGIKLVSGSRHQPQSKSGLPINEEEERKRVLAAEREKRAAAAERRIAAMSSQQSTTTAKSTSVSNTGSTDVLCSCCNASLAGKVPFHRYHYKYCSTTCMQVHREMLEDG